MSASMYDYIRTIVPEERLLFHEPMSRHTTFRVGGEAECMAVVETKEELSQLISYLGRIEQDYFVLGNGSNLLVGDKGYRGIIVKLGCGIEWTGICGGDSRQYRRRHCDECRCIRRGDETGRADGSCH